VGTPKDFTNEGLQRFGLFKGVEDVDTINPDNWLNGNGGSGVPAGSAGLFAFTTAGHPYSFSRLGAAETLDVSYWRTSAITWFVSGTLFVIAWVLLPTSWSNKLSLLLLIAFGAAMYALQDSAQVVQGLSAARFGLLAMVALWVIHAVTRPRVVVVTPVTPMPVAPPPATNPPTS
jgi:hypothetical protein